MRTQELVEHFLAYKPLGFVPVQEKPDLDLRVALAICPKSLDGVALAEREKLTPFEWTKGDKLVLDQVVVLSRPTRGRNAVSRPNVRVTLECKLAQLP
jgi:hypothetical protein